MIACLCAPSLLHGTAADHPHRANTAQTPLTQLRMRGLSAAVSSAMMIRTGDVCERRGTV